MLEHDKNRGKMGELNFKNLKLLGLFKMGGNRFILFFSPLNERKNEKLDGR